MVSTFKFIDDVTLGEMAEVLVTVVSTVRAMVTHQGVGHVLDVVFAREGGRSWCQMSCAGKGRTIAAPPAQAAYVTRQERVRNVPRRALHSGVELMHLDFGAL